MEPDDFSADILKGKSRKMTAAAFIRLKYNVNVIPYKKVHVIIYFSKQICCSWTPTQENLKELPCKEASALACQRNAARSTTRQLPPAIVTLEPSSAASTECCANNVVTPTNSGEATPELQAEDEAQELIGRLIKLAPYGGGSAPNELQGS